MHEVTTEFLGVSPSNDVTDTFSLSRSPSLVSLSLFLSLFFAVFLERVSQTFARSIANTPKSIFTKGTAVRNSVK